MVLLQQKNQIEKVIETNESASQFGLVLSEEDARLILDEKNNSLQKQRRVEFGEGITPKIIYEFCDSGYINQDNYVDTIIRLQEIFYLYKNEMQDKITDDELLHFMREQFESVCFGDLDDLEDTCLFHFAKAVCSEYEGYNIKIQYEAEEFIPIVAKLAGRYTSYESTSIPYEKAGQLMGAVLYCIHETGLARPNAVAHASGIPAQQAYENGVLYVEKKVKKALELYHKILRGFSCYENRCLHDTFVKDLPEFFKWYDISFDPQNTIVTLDYPVLEDLSACTGIDKIYAFLQCIYLEQRFLKHFPKKYVTSLLSRHHNQYQDIVFNLCEIVFTSVAGHLLAQKPMSGQKLQDSDYQKIENLCLQMSSAEMKVLLADAVKVFVKQYYRNCKGLPEYLTLLLDDMIILFKNAALHHSLPRVV